MIERYSYDGRRVRGIHENQRSFADFIDSVEVKPEQSQAVFPRQAGKLEIHAKGRPAPHELVRRDQRDRMSIKTRPDTGFSLASNLFDLPTAEAAAEISRTRLRKPPVRRSAAEFSRPMGKAMFPPGFCPLPKITPVNHLRASLF